MEGKDQGQSGKEGIKFGEAMPVAPAARFGEAMEGRAASGVSKGLKVEKVAPVRSDADWAWIMGWVGHVDEQARQAEATWGIDRLPRLVPVEMAAKFYSQASKYQEALRTGSRADVEWEAGRMLNAWKALDAQANMDGYWKYGDGLGTHDVWEVEALDASKSKVVVSLVRTREDAKRLVDQLAKLDPPRNTQVWTLDEVGQIISSFPDLVTTKKVFPGAEVTNVRAKPPVDWTVGDAMPENMGGAAIPGALLGD